MDTKLKKSHKMKNLIIALVVLIPALVLTCLYPQMERAMLDKKEQRLTEWEERKAEYEKEQEETPVTEETIEIAAAEPMDALVEEWFYLQDEFVNYAIEASYFQHAMLLQEATGFQSYTEVLNQHGWINDFYEFTAVTPYYVKYIHEDEDGAANEWIMSEPPEHSSEEEMEMRFLGEFVGEARETQMKSDGYLGYLMLKYDSYGKLSDIRMNVEDNVVYDNELYQRAKESIEQYENNAFYYVQNNLENNEENVNMAMQICPKNFQAIYLIYAGNERLVRDETYEGQPVDLYYTVEPYYAPYELYFATGAYWIVLALAIFVFLAAIILPFFKKLETGWENLFSIPAEIMLCIAMGGIALAYGMCILMSVTTMTELQDFIITRNNEIALLGYEFSVSQCYYIMLAVNFLGWAVAFFMEYICAAQLRQFFCGPVYYIKNRLLVILFVRWIWKKCKKLYHYVTDIDINEDLHKSIIKIILANAVIVTIICCMWFVGIFGVIAYSIILYILLKKYGQKLQGQYQSISNKSQQMKYELITNVSHDLKTPLTAIITYVDLLKNPDLTEEERKSYVETLDVKSQRLKVLIEDLFEVSKANSGNVQMNFMDVDVVKLMKEVRVEMSDKIEQSNLDFRWNLPEEKVVLSLDGQRTYRIFENLLNNSIKYAMPFTRVYVDIVNGDSEVVITFKNMSAQELNFDAEHLTERFVRGDSARNSEGSGLGLAIAKSFTELQNGQFDISIDGDLFKVTIRFRKK